MAPVRTITTHRTRDLTEGWELTAVAPDAAGDPTGLAALAPQWLPATVPGTVASALRVDVNSEVNEFRNFDAEDWWYRARFPAAAVQEGLSSILKLDGLATVAEVWLNNSLILTSTNMFLEHTVDVSGLLQPYNELYIRFQSLQTLLAQRRPRPRWRTALVEQQGLRWFRTTLLGRMPGWSPLVRPVGPWRAVSLITAVSVIVESADLRTVVAGTTGILAVRFGIRLTDDTTPAFATLVVGDYSIRLGCQSAGAGRMEVAGELRIPHAALWWPHTHGRPSLYPVRLHLGDQTAIDCGFVGFRTIAVVDEGSVEFGFRVNGQLVFARGACWTTLNIVTLSGTPQAYRAALEMARDAGMNMLRIGGTMVYEQSIFYDLCDELGILVWQDFMLANMDYPSGDSTFVATLQQEAEQVLDRLQARPCLALLCGSSEVEQQAAMLGIPRGGWANPIFSELLPDACRRYRPDVSFLSSSPSGGTWPFQVNRGTAHYYGVGAYMRPLLDARHSGVRFASECLGFANIPEDRTIDLFIGSDELAIHHPQWKARTPRDVGSGYDFEDVRDYYLQHLFAVDPMRLRASDVGRYLELGRVTTGEVMGHVFSDWRRKGSSCHGGLVWFYQDLWSGAGWGILDATGWPKAAYYYLKRALAPVALFFSDEGLNGLQLHAINDTAMPIHAEIQVSLYRHHKVLVTKATQARMLNARDGAVLQVDALFDSFLDLTYAYRFGPPGHDLVVATMRDTMGVLLADAFYTPAGLTCTRDTDLGLEATAAPLADGSFALTLRTIKYAQAVAIRAGDWLPSNNYLHIEPGGERVVVLTADTSAPGQQPLRGSVQALNSFTAVRIMG